MKGQPEMSSNPTVQWDYIVVGGGTSGAIMASRLSEDPSVRVLVLEAGPDFPASEAPSDFSGIDLEAIGRLAEYPDLYWPQVVARPNGTQEPMLYERGRGVGGSSSINAMVALRGSSEDYDSWAAEGASGWAFADVLTSFRRLERDLDFPESDFHSSTGPIPIYREPESEWGGIDRALKESALLAGHPWTEDANAPDATGVSPVPANYQDGKRVSTNAGYLEAARSRSNITIKGDVLVDRVLITDSVTRGVQLADGSTHRVAEGGEVILSAGAINSPTILQRSGIGPADLLAQLGIDVVADLPVGDGLQDHAGVWLAFPSTDAARRSTSPRPTHILLRYSSNIGESRPNDMMMMGANEAFFPGQHGSALGVILHQPFSRGSVRITSTDPAVGPEVDMNLLQHPADRARISDGLRRAHELLESPPFSEYVVRQPARLDEEAQRARAMWVWHASSTCRMGGADSAQAVVGPDARVRGVDGLRVADASIMPSVPSAPTNIAAMMIGEHVAAIIRRDIRASRN
ncbi:GMC family oxidoreductase [Microbacterium faecale]|nr:GMC family oxidoreductase N-terminal domain-containing protein [Microbacterium faecale]